MYCLVHMLPHTSMNTCTNSHTNWDTCIYIKKGLTKNELLSSQYLFVHLFLNIFLVGCFETGQRTIWWSQHSSSKMLICRPKRLSGLVASELLTESSLDPNHQFLWGNWFSMPTSLAEKQNSTYCLDSVCTLMILLLCMHAYPDFIQYFLGEMQIKMNLHLIYKHNFKHKIFIFIRY